MTYIEQFEADLAKVLEVSKSDAEIIVWTSEKMLESYRNGIKAGQKGETVKRDGKSRRHSFAPKAQ